MSTHNPRHKTFTPVASLLTDDASARAMARNVAAWTAVSVRAFDIEAASTDTLWWRQPGGSPIYIGAVVTDGHAPAEQLAADLQQVQQDWGANRFHIYESWANRDLGQMGFELRWQNPWYVRPPAPAPPPVAPDGLDISTVTTIDELAEFEVATAIGFNESDTDIPARFSQHAPATLEDPGMYYLVARLDGHVVASTILYVTDDMAGIYGISTLPAMRRRGYGTALVQTCVAICPELPISVYPDPESLPMYTPSGFSPAGEIAVWESPAN